MVVMDCGVEITGPLSARDYKDPGTDGLNKNSAKMVPVFSAVYENHPSDSRVKELGDVSSTVRARWGTGGGNAPMVSQPAYAIQGSMIGRNDNAGPQGDGINEEVCFTQNTIDRHAVAQPISIQDVRPVEKAQNGKGWNDDGTAYTVDTHATQGVAQPIAFEPGKMKRLGYGDAEPGLAPTLRAEAGDNQLSVAYNIAPGKGELKDDIHVTDAHVSKTIDASGSNPSMHQGGAAIVQPVGTDLFNGTITGDISMTLKRGDGNPAINQPTVMQAMAVRRLTPVECERLQGFPDHYTDIKPKGKPTSDGPRYKALGNSMAVPVMAWIGKRIQEVENIK
jgi:site-specific DNA-cytosine methylase